MKSVGSSSDLCKKYDFCSSCIHKLSEVMLQGKEKLNISKLKLSRFIITFRCNYAIFYGQVQVRKGGFNIKGI